MKRPISIDSGYIKSTVRVAGLLAQPFDLPPVVGRSLASTIADLVKADCVGTQVSVIEQRQPDQSSLTEDLAVSDRVQQQLVLSLKATQPGMILLQGLGLLAGPVLDTAVLLPALLAERDHHDTWWTTLNELRQGRELPALEASTTLGTAAERERYYQAQQAFNLAAFGGRYVALGDSPALAHAEPQVLFDLLEAEREFAVIWWSRLNAMRCRGELPEWVISNRVGHGPDWDRWEVEARQVNVALFGVTDPGTSLWPENQRHQVRRRV